MDLTPKMDNLITVIKRDLNNTAANLEQLEKCGLDVLSLQRSKVTESKAYKKLESLESKIKLSSNLITTN